MRNESSVNDPERRFLDNIPDFTEDAAPYVASDPLWDMERRWRKLSHNYDDIPGSCFRQCADELRRTLLTTPDPDDAALAECLKIERMYYDKLCAAEAEIRTLRSRVFALEAALSSAHSQERHPRYPFDVNPEKGK